MGECFAQQSLRQLQHFLRFREGLLRFREGRFSIQRISHIAFRFKIFKICR